MDPYLQPKEEEVFKAGLWELHEKTSKLPPLTDCESLALSRTERLEANSIAQ